MSQTEENPGQSWAIGFPVRRTAPAVLSEVAAALLTKVVPCYGNYSKDVARCQSECLLRDGCRVALGLFAATQVPSLLEAEATTQSTPQPIPEPAAPPSPWRKVYIRRDGQTCGVCTKIIEKNTECLSRKADGMLRHMTCGDPDVTA